VSSAQTLGLGVFSLVHVLDDERQKPDRHNMAQRTTKQTLFGAAVWIAGITALVLWLTPSTEEMEAREAAREADPTYASRTACQEFIRQSLVAPSTAEFVRVSDWPARELANGTIRVEATLDAENGFGAMLRQNMTCEVRKANGYWQLESLTEG
jgi:hypothetical protein